jgi:hypothetical protein
VGGPEVVVQILSEYRIVNLKISVSLFHSLMSELLSSSKRSNGNGDKPSTSDDHGQRDRPQYFGELRGRRRTVVMFEPKRMFTKTSGKVAATSAPQKEEDRIEG